MTPSELAAKIDLDRRAIVMAGTLTPRMKNQGALPGLTPHYAMPGCPPVRYTEQGAAAEEPNSAEIELSFQEMGFPLPSALAGYAAKQGNLIQVMFGRNGQSPTQAEYRVLREAGTLIGRALEAKREVIAATLPILSPGQMGATVGRHYLIGLFDSHGKALWLHPAAVERGLFKAPWPEHQKERSVVEVPVPAVAVTATWYEPLATKLRAANIKGKALHETVLRARGQQLVELGVAPTLEAGTAIARLEAPEPGAARKAPPAPAPAQAPAQHPEAATPASTGTGKKLMDSVVHDLGRALGPAKGHDRER